MNVNLVLQEDDLMYLATQLANVNNADMQVRRKADLWLSEQVGAGNDFGLLMAALHSRMMIGKRGSFRTENDGIGLLQDDSGKCAETHGHGQRHAQVDRRADF